MVTDGLDCNGMFEREDIIETEYADAASYILHLD